MLYTRIAKTIGRITSSITWQETAIKDPFNYLFQLKGECFREQPGRKVLKFIEYGNPYFVKLHFGVGWQEIFKNFFQARLPVIGAANELRALKKLASFGFVPSIIGYGFRGLNPAKQQSFIITKALIDTISLENFCLHWPKFPPSQELKRKIIYKVATLARTIHEHGINHRDFYLCHFLIDFNFFQKSAIDDLPTMFVIDWHRAQLRSHVPLRWRIGDIARLYFSTMNIGLTRRDLAYFIKIYGRQRHKNFWGKVENRAVALFRKNWRKLPLTCHAPFYLAIEEGDFLEVQKIIKHQPRRYMVILGKWRGISVWAQLFPFFSPSEEKEIYDEEGKKLCLLKQDWSKHKALYVRIYVYLA
jgi:heptose I phosphotransferase